MKHFLCITIDLYDENVGCHFSKVGYLDVDETYRMSGEKHWTLLVRDCAT